MWLIEATRHNVLQLDDRGIERALPEFVGRPTLVKGTASRSSAAWADCPRTRS